MAKLWPHAHDLPLILPFWHWRQKRRPGKLRRAEGCLVAHKAVYVMRPIARTQPYTCAVLTLKTEVRQPCSTEDGLLTGGCGAGEAPGLATLANSQRNGAESIW